MTDDSGFNDDINDAIDDLMPDGVDPNQTSPDSDSEDVTENSDYDNRRWGQLLEEWHSINSVDEYRRNELVEREIERYVETLDLPDNVAIMSEEIFNQYIDTQESLLIELSIAASVYSAVKINEIGITPDGIIKAGNDPLDQVLLLRRSKDIVTELGLDPEAFFNSSMYVDEFCDGLNLPRGINERAKRIIRYCDESGASSGKSPTGWAAAAIYLACVERNRTISQDAVSDVANTSNVTIRNRYKEQREVVVERERPDNIEEMVNWACERVGLPDVIRSDAKAYIETEPDLSVVESEEISATIDEDPCGWAMAAVKLAANTNGYKLNYRPLKILSGYEAANLQRRMQALKKAIGVIRFHPDKLKNHNTDSESSTVSEDSESNSGGESASESKMGNIENDDLIKFDKSRLRDIIELQPTSNSELQNRWDMESGSEVHQYLSESLDSFYTRDDDYKIIANQSAERIIESSDEK